MDFGFLIVLFSDDLITVGWGKKETQFHGSEGKQAALVKATLVSYFCILDKA